MRGACARMPRAFLLQFGATLFAGRGHDVRAALGANGQLVCVKTYFRSAMRGSDSARVRRGAPVSKIST